MTNYPAQIDNSISLPAVVDNLTPVSGSAVNRLRDAILAVEAELGVKPSASYSTVRSRLDTIETALNNLQIIKLAGDLGNTLNDPFVIGIRGRPVSSVAPNLNDVLVWDGLAWSPSPVYITFSKDIAGNNLVQTVVGIQGNPILAQTLGNRQDGFTLTWSNSDGKWEAKSTQRGITQAVWHLNQNTGNDNNDGLTAGTALKTAAELSNRFGVRPYINQTIDIYIHADMDPNDVLIISGQLGPLGFVNYHGVPTVIHSGTLSAVTAFNQSTNQADEIADGTLDWTPYIGLDGGGHAQLVVITTGSSDGPSYTWVAKELTGPNRARVSFLGLRSISQGYPYFEAIGPASPGNTYEIWQLPIISNVIFDYQVYTQVFQPQVFAEFLSFPTFPTPVYPFLASECSIPNLTTLSGITYLGNCLYTGSVTSTGSMSTWIGLALNASLINNGPWIALGLMMQTSQVFYDVLGSAPATATFESHHAAYGIAVFDCATPFLIHYGGTLLLEAAIWGSGNTGTTIELQTGGRCLITGAASAKLFATNSGNDFTIDSYTSLPAIDPVTFVPTASRSLTFANFITTVAGGGFGEAVFNPRFPTTGMIATS